MDRPTEERYLISIDGGGTKTGICVYDCVLQESRFITCGGGNYKTHGIDTVLERIMSGLREILPDEPDIPNAVSFLVMGISGCDSARDIEIYTEMMLGMGFPKEKLLICNDSELIFRSIANPPGICIVAGTGTIALSFERNGSVRRAGGWGAPISDEGSGYWIGAEIIRHYLDWIDGNGISNSFYRKFLEELPCESDDEAAAILASMDPAGTAEWALPVFEAAPENPLCREIITAAAGKAARLTAAVWRKSSFESEPSFCIVESGSLFKSEMYESDFHDALRKMLPKGNYAFIRAEENPAEEGIRLAMKMAGLEVTTQSRD